MDSRGFNIELNLDELTGYLYMFPKFFRFISGGNNYNCLTWMDKMGSSTSAGNKGIPATSRCGVPIELVALLKNCLNFV